MSEEGWRAFLAAEDLHDWVVLHGGPTAVFTAASVEQSGALAAALTRLSGVEEHGVAMTIMGPRLSVRLTRGFLRVEHAHAELAREISAVARSRGAVADRGAAQEVQVAIAAKGDLIDLEFWRAVLGYAPLAEDNAVDPLGHGSTVWMQELDDRKSLRHAMHIDVSVGRDQIEARLKAALAAGGRIVDDSGAPEGWILSDRAGNRVCIAAWPDGSWPEEDSAPSA